jgi:DNA-directed DNA polymerase III PolC
MLMKPLVNLALRTEYSFRETYGFAKLLPEELSVYGCVGIADINNTFGHYYLEKECKKNNTKPIFGTRLSVWPNLEKTREYIGPEYIFLAKNKIGLEEIYLLIRDAYVNFYYAPRLDIDSVRNLSENVIVIAENFFDDERIDYIALTPTTPLKISKIESIPKVYISNNAFTTADQKMLYEILAGSRKDGKDGFVHKFDSKVHPRHILSSEEHFQMWGREDAIENSYIIADSIERFEIPSAPMVKYDGELTIQKMCLDGALSKGVSLFNEEYAERLDYELNLIEEKGYTDYFLIVADMIEKAKKKMLVGPSRGSSGGSLVCYLMGITEIDPIKFNLLFERFIDINRLDLPDIDVDFPDKHRASVVKQLVKDYGAENVSHIANINQLRAKSALGEFANALDIPVYAMDDLKESMVVRIGGDTREDSVVLETFDNTEVGAKFIEKYPKMRLVSRLENHASHLGTHAAGIVVCSEPLYKYGGVNVRDDTLMMNKKGAEAYNLLKIDCLGLRTLTVLQECAALAGFHFSKFYELSLDDQKVFQLFRDMRLSGIFQFEGYTIASINREVSVTKFDDLAAISALGRPGPLQSGGAATYMQRKNGTEKIKYVSNHESFVRNTEETFGIIVYQEQLMNIAREMGGMGWDAVSELRKAASKSLGQDFFNQFKPAFVEGATKNGVPNEEIEAVWAQMFTFGSWGFNKSHAVGYGMITYWTAWAKVYHPIEFTVANLNNAQSEESALKILRDAVRYDGVEYVAFDPDFSEINWSIHDGKILGGLKTAKGIADKKAKEIMKARKAGTGYTPSMVKMLMAPNTIFEILFPCEHLWGKFYNEPRANGLDHPPTMIEDIESGGEMHIIIGKLTRKNLRDLNEWTNLQKRDGQKVDDNPLFLNLYLEDDTDSVICQIDRWSFEEKGRSIFERGRIDFDWYIVKGETHKQRRIITVKEIFCLTTEMMPK